MKTLRKTNNTANKNTTWRKKAICASLVFMLVASMTCVFSSASPATAQGMTPFLQRVAYPTNAINTINGNSATGNSASALGNSNGAANEAGNTGGTNLIEKMSEAAAAVEEGEKAQAAAPVESAAEGVVKVVRVAKGGAAADAEGTAASATSNNTAASATSNKDAQEITEYYASLDDALEAVKDEKDRNVNIWIYKSTKLERAHTITSEKEITIANITAPASDDENPTKNGSADAQPVVTFAKDAQITFSGKGDKFLKGVIFDGAGEQRETPAITWAQAENWLRIQAGAGKTAQEREDAARAAEAAGNTNQAKEIRESSEPLQTVNAFKNFNNVSGGANVEASDAADTSALEHAASVLQINSSTACIESNAAFDNNGNADTISNAIIVNGGKLYTNFGGAQPTFTNNKSAKSGNAGDALTNTQEKEAYNKAIYVASGSAEKDDPNNENNGSATDANSAATNTNTNGATNSTTDQTTTPNNTTTKSAAGAATTQTPTLTPSEITTTESFPLMQAAATLSSTPSLMAVTDFVSVTYYDTTDGSNTLKQLSSTYIEGAIEFIKNQGFTSANIPHADSTHPDSLRDGYIVIKYPKDCYVSSSSETLTIDVGLPILLEPHSTADNKNCIIQKQNASDSLFKITNNSTVKLIDTAVTGAGSTSSIEKGGAFNVASGSKLIVSSGSISGFKAQYGGAIYSEGVVEFDTERYDRTNNIASDAGGVITNNITKDSSSAAVHSSSVIMGNSPQIYDNTDASGNARDLLDSSPADSAGSVIQIGKSEYTYGMGLNTNVGVYSLNHYKKGDTFAKTFVDSASGQKHLYKFTNNRITNYYGSAGSGNALVWEATNVCKVTEKDSTGQRVTKAFTSLQEAFDYVAGSNIGEVPFKEGDSETTYAGLKDFKGTYPIEMLVDNYDLSYDANYINPPLSGTNANAYVNIGDKAITLTTGLSTKRTGVDIDNYLVATGSASTFTINKAFEGGISPDYANDAVHSHMFGIASGTVKVANLTLEGNEKTVSRKKTYDATETTSMHNFEPLMGGAFYIEKNSKSASATNAPSLTLQSGATVQNFFAYAGGAIYCKGESTVTIDGATVTNNTCADLGSLDDYSATGCTQPSGGAIFMSGSSDSAKAALNINSGTISYNSGAKPLSSDGSVRTHGAGGAIALGSYATLNMSDGNIINNGNIDHSDGTPCTRAGGAIFCATQESLNSFAKATSSTVNITGGTISNNHTRSNGGAIYCKADSLTISDGTFSGNYNTGTGGAIGIDSTDTNISGGTFSGNYSASNNNGGAMQATNANVTLTGGTFSGNSTNSGLGGAIIVTGSSASLTLKEGGTEDEPTTPTITQNGSITVGTKSYSTKNGGGIYASSGASVTMEAGTVSQNKASTSGGGVYLEGATLNLKGGSIENNTASTSGGGVFAASTTTASANVYLGEKKTSGSTNTYSGSGVISNNTAALTTTGASTTTGAGGGGVYLSGNSTNKANLHIYSGDIKENTSKNGAGIYSYLQGATTMEGGTISSNKSLDKIGGSAPTAEASAAYGAGLLLLGEGEFTMSGGEISKNASSIGGAISVGDSTNETGTVSITGGTISENTATLRGGAIYLRGGSSSAQGSVSISGGTISKNQATNSGAAGGAIYTDNAYAALTISGSEIKENSAAEGGAVLALGNTTISGGTVQNNATTADKSAAVAQKLASATSTACGTITLQGAPTITNNSTSTTATTPKKNLLDPSGEMLWQPGSAPTNSEIHSAKKIQIGNSGLSSGASIGIYSLSNQNEDYIFAETVDASGASTTASTSTNAANLAKMTNDRVNGLEAKACTTTGSSAVLWSTEFEYVCTVEDAANGEVPFKTLQDAAKYLEGTEVYGYTIGDLIDGTTAYPLRMIKDCTLDEKVTFNAETPIDFKTASKDSGIAWPYKGSTDYAIITRGTTFTSASMFTLSSATVTISNLTIDGAGTASGGVVATADGGIINVAGTTAAPSSLTLSANATLQNSKASNNKGGAIYVSASGSLFVNGGTITGCQAAQGGAIYGSASVTLTGGTIENNATTDSNHAAVEVADNNKIWISGTPTVYNNYTALGATETTDSSGNPTNRRDVLDQSTKDAGSIIGTSEAVGSGMKVGVYSVNSSSEGETFGKTFDSDKSTEVEALGRSDKTYFTGFINNQNNLAGMAKVVGDPTLSNMVWTDYVCQIIHANGTATPYYSLASAGAALTTTDTQLQMLSDNYYIYSGEENVFNVAGGSSAFKTLKFTTAPTTADTSKSIRAFRGTDGTATLLRRVTSGSQTAFTSSLFTINQASGTTLSVENLELDGSSESSMTSTSGGGIFTVGGTVNSTNYYGNLVLGSGAVLQNNNETAKNGGAILVSDYGTLTMNSGSAITNCQASGSSACGGAIYITSGTTHTINGKVSITGNYAAIGGAICAAAGTVTFTGPTDAEVAADTTDGNKVLAITGNYTKGTSGTTGMASGAVSASSTSATPKFVFKYNVQVTGNTTGKTSSNSGYANNSSNNIATASYDTVKNVYERTGGETIELAEGGLGSSAQVGVYSNSNYTEEAQFGHTAASTAKGTDYEANYNKFLNDRNSTLKGAAGEGSALIWMGVAICKVTEKITVDGALKVKTKNFSTVQAAINYINTTEGTVPFTESDADTSGYATFGSSYPLEMLVDNYEITSTVTISTTKPITFTSGTTTKRAGVDIDDYPADNVSGGIFTVKKGASDTAFNMFKSSSVAIDFRVANLTLDGNGANSKSTSAGAFSVSGSSTVVPKLALQSGATVQNFVSTNTTSTGGAIYAQYGNVTIDGGKVINNSSASTSTSSATTTYYGGGAIYCSNGTLTINSGEISGNSTTINRTSAYSANKGGGAIYSYYCAININGGNISNNSLINAGTYSGGGAIYSYLGPVNISGGTISGNYTTNGPGGAIYAKGSSKTAVSVTLSGGTISGNSTSGQGGGAIHVGYGNLTLKKGGTDDNPTQPTITDNGNITVSGTDYKATNGGAIYAEYTPVKMEAGTISNNEGSSNGGAIYLSDSTGNFKMTDGTISGNRSTGSSNHGGAIYSSYAPITLTGGTISGNSCKRNGGAICASGADASVTLGESGATAGEKSPTITGNGNITVNGTEYKATNGGGIYSSNAAVTMYDGKISGNEATAQGGGVFVTGSTASFSMTGGTVGGSHTEEQTIDGKTTEVTVSDGNKATGTSDVNGLGGGIYAASSATVNVGAKDADDSTLSGTGVISNNTAASTVKGGGGIYADCNLNIYSGTISSNQAKQGAGVFVNGTRTFNMEGGSITANKALTGDATEAADQNYGGGAFVSSNSTATITGGSVTSNSAYTGGGIYQSGGTLNIAGGSASEAGASVSSNTATYSGGGVHMNYGTLNIYGYSKVNANSASIGGAVYLTKNAAGNIYGNATIKGNATTTTGTEQSSASAAVGYEYQASQSNKITIYGSPNITGNYEALTDGTTAKNVLDSSAAQKTGTADATIHSAKKVVIGLDSEGAGLDSTARVGIYSLNNSGEEYIFAETVNASGASATSSTRSDSSNYKTIFSNDKDNGKFAAACESGSGIKWTGYLCTVTDATNGEVPFLTLAEAASYLAGTTVSGKTIGGFASGASSYPLKMLKDYTLTAGITFASGAADTKAITFTTAAKGDGVKYPYTGSGTTATITRGSTFTNASMFTLNSANMTVENLTLDGNSANVTAAASGGAINVSGTSSVLKLGDSATVQNSKVSANGGGVYVNSSGSLAVEEGGVITNCSATGNDSEGGGIYGNATVAGTISGCSATWSGGGVSGSVTLTGTITDCHATGGNGGGVGGTATISGGTISNCTAVYSGRAAGGGVYGKIVMTSGTITGCTSDYLGGAVCTDVDTTDSTISGGTISGCSAEDAGGAIFASGSLTISGTASITGNTAANGGAVFVDDGCALSIAGSTKSGEAVEITGNHTTGDDAGAIQTDTDEYIVFTGNVVVKDNDNGVTEAAATEANPRVIKNVYDGTSTSFSADQAQIRVGATGLGDEASIGVYSKENYNKNDNFGITVAADGTTTTTSSTSTNAANLNKFTNDKDSGLKGKAASTGEFIYWDSPTYICKVTEKRTEQATEDGGESTSTISTVPFETVQAAFDYIAGSSVGEIPFAESDTGDRAEGYEYFGATYPLEMIVDDQEIAAPTSSSSYGVTISTGAAKPVTFTSGTKVKRTGVDVDAYLVAEDEADTTLTLKKGGTTASFSMFGLQDGILTLKDITLDGSDVTKEGTTTSYTAYSGGAFNCNITSSTESLTKELTVGSGATIQNFKSSNSGGAIECGVAGTITIDGGTISGCYSNAGGAIDISGDSETERTTLNINSGEISKNSAKYRGGAIFAGYNADIYINGGTISGNHADVDDKVQGGAISSWGAPITISSGTITGNYCKATYAGSAAYGGGISTTGTVTMTGGEISNNYAYSVSGSALGGGISTTNTLTITGGTVVSNAAYTGDSVNYWSPGGGIYISGGTLTLDKGTKTETGEDGETTTITTPTIKDNGYLELKDSDGNTTATYANTDCGGIYAYNSKVTMEAGTISGNQATISAGGIGIGGTSVLKITGGTIGGSHEEDTGTIDSDGNKIYKTVSDGNKVTSANTTLGGGGIYAWGYASVYLGSKTVTPASAEAGTPETTTYAGTGTISNNSATYKAGGVGLASENAHLYVYSGNISENTAEYYGGGVACTAGKIDMEGGTISGNAAQCSDATHTTAHDQLGGGIYIAGSSTHNISGEAAITSNQAQKGGAVYVAEAANVNFVGPTDAGKTLSVTGNASTSTDDTGAVAAPNGGKLIFSNNVSVIGNTNKAASDEDSDTETDGGDTSTETEGTSTASLTAEAETKTIPRNVYDGSDENAGSQIQVAAAGLGSDAKIGVYSTNSEEAGEIFAHTAAETAATSTNAENLSKFVNDRNTAFKGVAGTGNNIQWEGKEWLDITAILPAAISEDTWFVVEIKDPGTEGTGGSAGTPASIYRQPICVPAGEISATQSVYADAGVAYEITLKANNGSWKYSFASAETAGTEKDNDKWVAGGSSDAFNGTLTLATHSGTMGAGQHVLEITTAAAEDAVFDESVAVENSTQVPEEEKVTVTFDANAQAATYANIGGETSVTRSVKANEALGAANIPTAEAKDSSGTATATFKGWSTNKDAEFDDSSVITSEALAATKVSTDTTYYAIWSVSVSLSLADLIDSTTGTSTLTMNSTVNCADITAGEVTAGKTVGSRTTVATAVPVDTAQSATNTTVADITFNGWNADKNQISGDMRADLLEQTVKANTTYYTTWKYYMLGNYKSLRAVFNNLSGITDVKVVNGSESITKDENTLKGTVQSTGSAAIGVYQIGTTAYIAPVEDEDSKRINVLKDCTYQFSNGALGGTISGSLDLSNLYTKNATNMYGMFFGSQENHMFSSITFGSSFDTSNVTTMQNMFYYTNVTSLDLSSFDTAKVTNMAGMFLNSALTSLDFTGFTNFNTSAVTKMHNMFAGCRSLATLDVSSFDTQSVENMEGMFHLCEALTSLDLSNFNTAKVTNMSGMFQYCSGLTNLVLSNFNTAKVTNMSYMFKNCTALTALNVSSFDTSNVENMSYMFTTAENATSTPKLTSLDLSNFNTAKVTNMEKMFAVDISGDVLSSLNLSEFDTSEVINMKNMFTGRDRLQTVTLGANFDFDTSVESCFLPTPSSAYITGADGKWYDTTTNNGYSPTDLATFHNALNEKRTYVAVPPTNYYWLAASGASNPSDTSGMLKTQSEIDEDMQVLHGTLSKTSAGKDKAAVTAEWEGYMTSDKHLYTKWSGSDAGTGANQWVEFRIIQVGEHDGDGSAVTFMATHSLPTAKQMNSAGANVGGWYSSPMRALMKSYVASGMSGLASKVKSVNKTTSYRAATSESWSTTSDNSVTSDAFWLLSYSEYTGAETTVYNMEGSKYSGCTTFTDLSTTRSGDTPTSAAGSFWWLRSPTLNNVYNYGNVRGNTGVTFDNNSNNYRGVVPCFAF